MPANSASSLTFEVERDGENAIVHCHGRLVAGVGEWFYPQIRLLIPECKCITLDLTDLTHLDSMGIGALVRLYVSARSSGCRFRLINLGPRIQQLLGITHLLAILTDMCEQGITLRF
ncbi:MAG TPA: STAS domain-containing protein [Terracidiphilus sp.]|nr:STAS domain-containing protein [Terracidiphilus sp.]